MNNDIALKLRDMGDKLAVDHMYRESSLAFRAAHRIEFLEQKIQDLEDMVKDAQNASDYWFKRAQPKKVVERKPLRTVPRKDDENVKVSDWWPTKDEPTPA